MVLLKDGHIRNYKLFYLISFANKDNDFSLSSACWTSESGVSCPLGRGTPEEIKRLRQDLYGLLSSLTLYLLN